MKKYIKYLALFCFAAVLLCGCKGKDEGAEADPLVLPDYMFDKVEKSDESCTDEEIQKIQEGINNWAKAYLLVDSYTSSEDKEAIDTGLYESIVSDKEREEVQKDRDEFYQDCEVEIESVSTEVTAANPATYEEKSMGVASCKVTITGTRNEEKFERNYDLELLINYSSNTVSVYEIGAISWK